MKFPEMYFKSRYVNTVFLGNKQEQQVATKFLDAVMANPDDAWAFVSKMYSPSLDLIELQQVLGAGVKMKVCKAFYINNSKNYLTRSVYVENPACNLRKMLHLRMIKEPDHNGAWKVYGVEQEECGKV